MNEKATMRSLALSIISIFLCIALLFGTTYAWFTASVTTGTNTIKTAGYDVTIEYSESFDTGYSALTDSTVLFNDVALAPGAKTGVKYIRITNSNAYDVTASASIGEVTTTGGINEMMLAFSTVTAEKTFADADYTAALGATAILNNVNIPSGGSVVIAFEVMLPDTATNADVTNTFTVTVGATQANS